jgi:hypothetical protein
VAFGESQYRIQYWAVRSLRSGLFGIGLEIRALFAHFGAVSLEDAVEGNPVFKEWARSWARRVIIVNAVRAINPQPIEESGRSSSATVSGNGKTPPADQVEIAAVLVSADAS